MASVARRYRSSVNLPLLVLLLVVVPLLALDPNTKLTDLVHTAWTGGEAPFRDVHDIAQTADGTLWLASTQGLFYFDGIRFARMEALSRTDIRHILSTRDGSLWVVFDSGVVSRLFHGNITTFSSEELPKANALAEDRDGSLVAATANGGLARFRYGRWQEIAHALHHSAKRSLYVWFDRDGVLWLETDNRLLKLPAGADRFIDTGIPVRPTIAVRRPFTQSADGTIWFADTESVRSVSPDSQHIEVKVGANALMADRQGTLWVASFGDGLWRLPPTTRGESIMATKPEAERLAMKDGLSGNRVLSVIEDREGNVWVGTELGLDRFRGSIFHRVPFPGADRIERISDSSGEGGILIKTADPPNLERLARDGKIASMHLFSVNTMDCLDSDGTIWVGTAIGLGKWTGSGIAYSLRLQNASIQAIGCGYGDIWIASAQQGVVLFSSGKVKSIQQLRPNVLAFYPKGPGLVWVTYLDGRITVYDNGKIRDYGKKDGVPEGAVRALVGEPAGELWVAGEGGVARFRNGRFQFVDVAPGYQLENLKRDKAGFLWLQAGKVVMRMAISEFDRAVANPGYVPHLEAYGALDGIPGVIKLISESPNRLWVATSDALGYLDIDSRPARNPLPPPVQIETLIADGKNLPASEGIVVPKLTHNLQIVYTAFSLTIPEKDQFRYKLEGVDKDWQEAGTRRQAYYTDLMPKHYRFIVKASNNDGVWNEQGAALSFSVDPAYYQTHWFQTACGALVLAGVMGLYRIRLRQIAHQFNTRFEERISERTRIARELHDTLLQSFQGSLFEFQAAQKLLSSRPEDALRTLNDAIGSAKAAIAEGREAIHELRSGTALGTDLAQTLRSAAREFLDAQYSNDTPAAFSVTVEGTSETLMPVFQDQLYQICRELLRNAFRHARARQIEVEIRYSSRELRIRIRDDGVGIDHEVLETGERPGHWGLPGARERAKLIGAQLDLWSELGAGTEIQITVPASIAYLRRGRFRPFQLFRRNTQFHAK